MIFFKINSVKILIYPYDTKGHVLTAQRSNPPTLSFLCQDLTAGRSNHLTGILSAKPS